MKIQRKIIYPPHRGATYQDVLDAPPDKVAEVIDGTLHVQPRPAMRHARASSGMGAKISPPSLLQNPPRLMILSR